jgi:cytochrome c-type biogenesis protein CcmE
MDPSRKRKVRFVVALSVATLLAGALVYTSFSASSEARTPSQLLTASATGETYKLTGKVEPGYKRDGTTTHFRVRDRAGSKSVPVSYDGALPDPFRAGREVIVTVRRHGDAWVGEHGSLITKCPSKFSADESKS